MLFKYNNIGFYRYYFFIPVSFAGGVISESLGDTSP
ncbi:hypothetical protein BTU51_0766 [Rickettsia rickettsii]|uniref:Uncharacterized protein n=1 Tax=Rickettsia rickettsii (strain Iowa) TaxID=452659 RepID=B0BXP2_RICRO|nr:hypothetical protein RrIowa_0766 [Rickettsia rickettsii str. Iowa]APU55568.1 hypothetical protein BTU50_0766 [Rickettsia rickettsii]APU56945.1 hypothetical protein BTU51_0766 [Rickettsia rickettsii]